MKNMNDDKILRMIDEIIYDIPIRHNLKKRINGLKSSELLEFIRELSDILQYYYFEKDELPDYLKFHVKEYFEKQAFPEVGSLPVLVVKYIQQKFQIVKNTLNGFHPELIPIVTIRNQKEIESNKVVLVDEFENKKVEISLIPQREKFLISFYSKNLSGNLTIKLQEGNHVIDVKHFANLSLEERVNFENLHKGNYVMELKGKYNKSFILDIESE